MVLFIAIWIYDCHLVLAFYACAPIEYEIVIFSIKLVNEIFRNLSEQLAVISFHYGQERESVRPQEGSHQFSTGNVIHPEPQVNARDRLRLSGNDRLPGAVLLARERLMQRLRGVTLSGSRLVLDV